MTTPFRVPTLLLALGSIGFGAAAHSAPAVSPQSLAGDWEYPINPPVKLVLHLRVEADGTLAGTVDTPDSPPKHVELSNVHLASNILSYSMGSMRGTFTEVISPDGKKMLGPHLWERVVKQAAISSRQLAGDWDSNGTVLRLRVDSSGTLTGKLETLGLAPSRQTLSHLDFDGNALSFQLPNEATFHGTLGSNGHAITGVISGTTTPLTWRQVKDASQAAMEDSKEKPSPTDGAWGGVGTYTASFPQVGLSKGTLHLVFHFGSNPTSCSVELVGDQPGSTETVPCHMTQTGNTVHLETLRSLGGVFTGTLNANTSKLNGSWTMGSQFHMTGPMPIELTRGAR